MKKEEVLLSIKLRIMDEYKKHPDLDWTEIASRKIYSQFCEYFERPSSEGGWSDSDMMNAVRYGSQILADVNFKTPSEWLTQYNKERRVKWKVNG
jgi:hypothetical protein